MNKKGLVSRTLQNVILTIFLAVVFIGVISILKVNIEKAYAEGEIYWIPGVGIKYGESTGDVGEVGLTSSRPSGPPTYSGVRVTHYYTPLESEEGRYINRLPTFEKNVKMQGSGIRLDGKILRYTGQVLDPAKGEVGSRGTTAMGTNPTAHRTIAADTNFFKLGQTIYLRFSGSDKWNGCYLIEDTGSAFKVAKGKHIDLYVGVGENDLKAASVLPQYAQMWIMDCEPGRES